ncbi:MAG TPA: lipoyl(octanoyl) transferase LipB [Gammaproteobacteria bacterium]|nr:lipoyl(octanoyl) transferase LipB [Gammaproteobacteria bacterium]
MKVRQLGQQEYSQVWQNMRTFTDQRGHKTEDEIWLVEHPAVFTQGQAGKAEHILASSDIPIIQSDRGGQITYHGPGQIIAYLLLDIRRRGIKVRPLVTLLEQTIIELLEKYDINATSRQDAPGVYADHKKIAALGLRIRRNGCYHGLSLNVNMDLTPFQQINPCGYQGLQVTQLSELVDHTVDLKKVEQQLLSLLLKNLDRQ